MSLTGSRTIIRRTAEQLREIQQHFEHSRQHKAVFCAAEGLALSFRTGVGSTRHDKTKKGHHNIGLTYCFASLSTNAFRCILRYPLDSQRCKSDGRVQKEIDKADCELR